MTVGKELELLTAKHGELEKAHAELQATSKAQAEELAALKESIAGIEAAKVEALKSAEAKTAEAEKAHAEAVAAHEQTKAELDKAQKALRNPAFADAGVRGVAEATAEGGSAAGKTFETFAEAHAAYCKIEDARERALFRVEHAEILGLK